MVGAGESCHCRSGRRRKGAGLDYARTLKKDRKLPQFAEPPGVATKTIELANDPEVDIARIADVLALDPAITAKILPIANAPMYARQRKTENFKQALMVIGLNATISLALSFSLLKSWRSSDQAGGLDHPLYWRRARLGGARAARSRTSRSTKKGSVSGLRRSAE